MSKDDSEFVKAKKTHRRRSVWAIAVQLLPGYNASVTDLGYKCNLYRNKYIKNIVDKIHNLCSH